LGIIRSSFHCRGKKGTDRQDGFAGPVANIVGYAPPSLFAYSSSILSSYNLSASRSSSVLSVCVVEATDCVEGFSTSRVVCAEAELVEVDFSVVEGIGTGILIGDVKKDFRD
jgi:hypothetical protein